MSRKHLPTALHHGSDQDRILMPVTEDGKSHPNKAVLVSAGENEPDQPDHINGKKVVNWVIKKNI